MRLPNGYGTVYKLSGNRRNPWIARVTNGWTVNAKTGKKKQNYSIIGYYKDQQSALQALADYNDSPYDVNVAQKTFAEIYELWNAKTSKGLAKKTLSNRKTAFNQCAEIHNMRICDIKQRHLQDVLNNNSHMRYDSVHKIQGLFNQIFTWCVANDYLKKSYAEGLKNPTKSTQALKEPFTTDEIKFLWDNVNENEYISMILILIYSGVRIGELLDLEKTEVDFDKQIVFIKDSKTPSGIRNVPIADKVLPYWRHFYNKSSCSKVFTTIEGEPFTYSNFSKRYWHPLLDNLNISHTIHETRHACVSQLTMNGADKTIIKFIVGHKSIMNLTEKVYTHIELSKLVETINLIP